VSTAGPSGQARSWRARQARRSYLEKLRRDDLEPGLRLGPAGTGKTYLAVAMARGDALAGKVDRIILSRPAVEAGERSASCRAT
jgi:phosphate starvation-inducible PhoH-like protein